MSRIITRRAPAAVTLATAYEDQSGDAPVLEIPEDLASLEREDLDALHAQAEEAFNDLYADGEDLDAGTVETLGTLADGIDSIRAEQDRRDAEAAERSEQAAALAARVRPEGEGDAPTDESAEAEGESEGGEETLAAETAETEGEAVVASGNRRISLQGVQARRARQRSNRPTEVTAERSMRDVLRANADVAGFAAGQGVDWREAGQIVDRRLAGYNHKTFANAAARNRPMKQSFAALQFSKGIPEEHMVTERTSEARISEIMDEITSEKRLPGGALVAAGGWCAPSETSYDLCELESRDGILSVPEIGINRGGLRNTLGPDFASIYANTGFCYTEAEDIAGDYDGAGGGTKPCFNIECPEFTDHRLALCGVCITGGLLQARGYPELVARVLRGALVAHDHRMNANFINGIVAGSTAVSLPTTQAGATAPILTAVELQVEHMRNVNRMARNATVEGVFPYWVRGAIRADLSRRLGVDLLSVPNSRVDSWFAERGIAPQYVYDWQGLESQAASAATSYPTSVDFLLYPAGTWVKGSQDIITLDTIYDSTLLGTNDYTALFTEEGWAAIQTCHDSRVVTVGVCPDGATHAGIDILCDGTEGP